MLAVRIVVAPAATATLASTRAFGYDVSDGSAGDAAGVPVTLQTSYLPASLCPDLQKHDLDRRHLIDILQSEYGVAMSRAEELVEPAIADDHDARHLGIGPGSPVFQIERRTYLADGRIAEFRRAVMRGDVYRYRLDLR